MNPTEEETIREHKISEPTQRFHFSVRTLLMWTCAVAVAISTPEWLGKYSIMAVFYGTLVLVAWRLSRWWSILASGAVAVIAAICAAGLMTVLNN